MKYKEWVFLFSGIFLAYAIFFAVAPFVSAVVNGHFYGGDSLYRLTWSHYVLPAAVAIATFLIIRWFLEEIDWPKTVVHYVIFLAAALVIAYFSFVVGVQAYSYTFMLYGARTMDLVQLWYFFLFTPFWAMVPGVLAGWLAALLTYYNQ